MRNNRVIITDQNGKPMAWSGDQLCYCTDNTWQDKPFPVKAYTVGRANKFIERSLKHKESGGLSSIEYRTMPFKSINGNP